MPTSAYDHHWSGSISALREISFYEKAETAGEILLRNRLLFLNKWRGIAERERNPYLLESGFIAYILTSAHTLAEEGYFKDALTLLDDASLRLHNDPHLIALMRFVEVLARKTTGPVYNRQEVVQ